METYLWYKAAHTIGWVMWVGGLIGLTMLLASHRTLAESTVKDLVGLERAVAIEMDIGAALALIFGIVLILETRNMGEMWVMKKGFFHVKLMLVLFLLALHGFIRVQVAKARRGDTSGISGAFRGVAVALFIGIVVMVVARPFGT